MITALSILKSKETYAKNYSTVSKHDAIEAMLEFAKLHVKAALEAACNEVYVICDSGKTFQSINEDSILNAYSLENIK